MCIDFDTEIAFITTRLTQVEWYLDCEKTILQSIKTQQDLGFGAEDITSYLHSLSVWLHKKKQGGNGHAEYTNYLFAAGCVDYLLRTP